MDTPQQYPTMWTTGYIGNVKVSFAFPIRNELEAYAQAKAITDKLIADGFTLHEPGLDAGEVKEQVGYVSRRQKKNDDATITPIIDVYSPNEAMKFKFISVYLNTPEDVTDFEKASGHKLSSLPLVPGKAALDKSDDSGAVVKVNQVTYIITKPNPYFDPDEKDISKMKPKHTFIRWETAAAQPKPEAPQPVSPATVPAGEPAKADPQRNARLQNEEIVLTEIVHTGTVTSNRAKAKNGDKFDGFGLIEDNGMKHRVRVWIFPEDVIQIKAHGYDFGVGKGYEIPVIMDTSDRAMTRIGSVQPNPNQPERKWDAAAWADVMNYATSKGLQVESMKDVLGVDKGGAWKRGFKAAIKEIDAYVSKQGDIDFMGVAS